MSRSAWLLLLLPRVDDLCLLPCVVLPPGPGGTLSPFRLLDCDSPGNVEPNADGDGAVRVPPPLPWLRYPWLRYRLS
jgi:hypothetical protein